jgi:hypothetical protein
MGAYNDFACTDYAVVGLGRQLVRKQQQDEAALEEILGLLVLFREKRDGLLTMPKRYGIKERSGSRSSISSTACAAEMALEVAAKNDGEQIHMLSSSSSATGSHFP